MQITLEGHDAADPGRSRRHDPRVAAAGRRAVSVLLPGRQLRHLQVRAGRRATCSSSSIPSTRSPPRSAPKASSSPAAPRSGTTPRYAASTPRSWCCIPRASCAAAWSSSRSSRTTSRACASPIEAGGPLTFSAGQYAQVEFAAGTFAPLLDGEHARGARAGVPRPPHARRTHQRLCRHAAQGGRQGEGFRAARRGLPARAITAARCCWSRAAAGSRRSSRSCARCSSADHARRSRSTSACAASATSTTRRCSKDLAARHPNFHSMWCCPSRRLARPALRAGARSDRADLCRGTSWRTCRARR